MFKFLKRFRSFLASGSGSCQHISGWSGVGFSGMSGLSGLCGSGTGISGGSGIITVQYDTICHLGKLQVYKRDMRIGSGWSGLAYLDHEAGCCDCTDKWGSGSGSGSGSGFHMIEVDECGCVTMPDTVCFSVVRWNHTGLSDNAADAIAGAWVLTYDDRPMLLNPCWRGPTVHLSNATYTTDSPDGSTILTKPFASFNWFFRCDGTPQGEVWVLNLAFYDQDGGLIANVGRNVSRINAVGWQTSTGPPWDCFFSTGYNLLLGSDFSDPDGLVNPLTYTNKLYAGSGCAGGSGSGSGAGGGCCFVLPDVPNLNATITIAGCGGGWDSPHSFTMTYSGGGTTFHWSSQTDDPTTVVSYKWNLNCGGNGVWTMVKGDTLNTLTLISADCSGSVNLVFTGIWNGYPCSPGDHTITITITT